MFEIRNPPFFFPFLFFIPTFILIFSKCMFESTAKATYLGRGSNVCIMILMQISQNCLVAVVHFWLHLLHIKLGMPTILINVIAIAAYLVIFGFTLYDFENTRHNMQIVLPSTYVAYLGRFGMEQKVFHEFWSNIKGTKAHSNSVSNIIRTTILDSPQFWILLLVVSFLFIILCLLLVVFNWKNIVNSVFTKKFLEKIDDFGMNTEVYYEQYYSNSSDGQSHFLYMFIFIHVLAFVDLITMSCILISREDFKARYFSYLPYVSSLLLALSHFEKRPSEQTLKNVNNLTRNFLPPGRLWLDTREDPIYPEVHADISTFCAYNLSSNKCQNNNKKERNSQFLKPEELPNVVLILYESFNPATYLISKEFIDEHVKNPNSLLTNTTYYNSEIMPFLHNFAKEEMVTFSGMQTLGLPSFSGLHSILTQEPPSQTYMNIINGWENEVDDIPSYFHSEGYRTMIVNANRFDFDGKQYWIYKKSREEEALYRMNCLSSYGDSFNNTLQRQVGDYSFVPEMRKDCTKKDVDEYLDKHKDVPDFPRFFDYATSYYPNQTQAKSIGIDPSTVYKTPAISVIGDRVVAKEFEAHWKQQKDILKSKGEKKPIFTLVSTVDGHMPYKGYDMPQFYPKIDPSIKLHTEQYRVANFIKVNTYTDKYFIKEVINWLKINDPNTIVLFTGDHGTRDIPAKEKNGKVTNNVKYDPKCVHESTGSDSLFYVSGGISYLGKDERIKKAFGLDKLAGKTVKFTVDHGDMIYTAEEIIKRLQGKELKPTNRKSRNIIDMSLDLLLNSTDDAAFSEKIDKSGWCSISMVSHTIEYHNGTRMVRFHPGDIEGAQVYKNCVYPTGLLPSDFDESKDKRNFYVIREQKNKNEKKKGLEFVNEALAFLSAENYLAAKNRLFNYKFRDENCIVDKNCKLPGKLPDLSFRDWPFIRFVLNIWIFASFVLLMPALIGALLKLVVTKLKMDKKDSVSLLDVD